jgi:uracil phosphoribosyltransferase
LNLLTTTRTFIMSNVHLIDHPLVQHKLTLMRRKDASTNSFRRLLNELASLMAYEVTRDMATQDIEIETPLETMTGRVIDGKKLVFVSILRAGTGILDGMLSVVPGARVGHIGLYRDPKTLTAVEYYFKMPSETCTNATWSWWTRCSPPATRPLQRWSGSRSSAPRPLSLSAC